MPIMPNQTGSKNAFKIFVSYRRDDSAGHTGRIYDRLAATFGDAQIFMDIDHIEPGQDFVQVMEEAVSSCDVLVAIIGRDWITTRGRTTRRLDDPLDFVRLEIRTALKQNILTIPVLVQGTSMPRAQDLPADMAELVRRNALEVSDLRWRHDVDRLLEVLERERTRRGKALQSAASAPSVKSSRLRNRKLWLAVGIAILVTAIGLSLVLASRFWTTIGKPTVSELRSFAFYTPTVNSNGSVSRTMKQANVLTVHFGNHTPLEMVQIPAGNFWMGSADEVSVAQNETPQHQVTVKSFYMSRYEITQELWQIVMGNNPSKQGPSRGDRFPVDTVSWNDATSFCAKLSQLTGRQFRLPTEAEWEYACRAGTTTPYAFGQTLTRELANNSGTRDSPVRVGELGVANAFGLSDMHGNLYEWCQDRYHPNYNGAPTDGAAWIEGADPLFRVVRGCSWNYPDSACRSASRDKDRETTASGTDGFRVVMVVQ
jgi:formylglycine-generating enzyme required for sulfatase activity